MNTTKKDVIIANDSWHLKKIIKLKELEKQLDNKLEEKEKIKKMKI